MVLGTLSAGEILTIAFESAVAVGCEKAVEGAWDKGKSLWGIIRRQLGREPEAEVALALVEQSQTLDYLPSEIVQFLQAELFRDPAFAEQVRCLAQEVLVLGQPEAENIAINATSHDESTQKVVGKIEAKEVNF
ncbi:MAG: hypothetical protein F6J87_13260 [Spirulina sp. SIO3F2]|nr:hypothetical protein [Spirulina sp. SIO3F2]